MTTVTHIKALHGYDLTPHNSEPLCAGLALTAAAGGPHFAERVARIVGRWFHTDLRDELDRSHETRQEGEPDSSTTIWTVGGLEFDSDHADLALRVAATQLDAVAPRLVADLSGETGLSDVLHELASDVWTHVRCAGAFSEGVEPW